MHWTEAASVSVPAVSTSNWITLLLGIVIGMAVTMWLRK